MIENRLKKGLGRGLSSLLGDSSKIIETNKVLIKDLKRNKFQPRKSFSKENLEDLTNSIRKIKPSLNETYHILELYDYHYTIGKFSFDTES